MLASYQLPIHLRKQHDLQKISQVKWTPSVSNVARAILFMNYRREKLMGIVEHKQFKDKKYSM